MKNEAIIKDMSAGVIVVSRNGHIILKNDAALRMFPPLEQSETLFEAIEKDETNSSLYDIVTDTIFHKNDLERKVIEYTMNDQTLHYDVHAKYTDDEESVILSITDITKEVAYGRHSHDATVVSTILISFIALWNILCVVWQKYFPQFDAHWMTLVLIGLACIVSFALFKLTDIDLKHMGLEFRGKGKAILINSSATLFLMLLMTVIKILFVKGYDRLLDFSVLTQVSTIYYPVTVLLQEILSRGVMHSTLEQVFTAKHRSLLAILVSSFSFAGLHLHLGLMFMLGAGLLLCVFGFIYQKQRSIWALCIPHYCLCIYAQMLGFL